VRRFAVAVALLLAFTGSAGAALLADPDPMQAQEWWLSRVGADRATPPGPGIPLLIVDSGVDPTHPEFSGRPDTTFLTNQTTVGREEYHGTIVASLAAAPANGQGIVGVYPTAAVDVYDASPDGRGITTQSAIAGIIEASRHCPAVINLSFGSVAQDPLLEDAVLTAFRNGCLIVAASGNSGEFGSPATYPAAWPHVFTVGATDANDQVTSFSTTGAGLDVVAPGDAMTAAVPFTRNASGYQTNLSGTSFSSPLVAAAAAWVWTVRPDLSAPQLADVLRQSARDIGAPGFDQASGWGMIDIPGALAAPTPPVDPGEPNDDVDEVKPGALFEEGQTPLTTASRPTTRIVASLDVSEDPRDVYRIWVPAQKTVRVTVAADGRAAARLWGPLTVSTGEGIKARRRDLRGQSISAGKKGMFAYVEVLLTGRAGNARYTLTLTAARR
jgi:subtilisin family serine protease